MTELFVIGYKGMLGRAIMEQARHLVPQHIGVQGLDRDFWSLLYQNQRYIVPRDSIVINAAGIVKGREDVLPAEYVRSNSLLPHLLAQNAEIARLIHVSTDCVFNGNATFPYTEDSIPSPDDFYGQTKLAGEVITYRNALTVRTSFIGFGQRGLVAWLLSQEKGATIDGYVNWLWNGFYVKELAILLLGLALDSDLTGLLHLEGYVLSKYELLQILVRNLRDDITVRRVEHDSKRKMVLSSKIAPELAAKVLWPDQFQSMWADARKAQII